MKLSDIKGDKVLDIVAELVVPIANIASDDKASEIFSRKPLPQGATIKSFIAERVKKSIPALIKDHKEDVVTILCTLNETPYDEYVSNLTMLSLMKDFTDLLLDDEFIALFG